LPAMQLGEGPALLAGESAWLRAQIGRFIRGQGVGGFAAILLAVENASSPPLCEGLGDGIGLREAEHDALSARKALLKVPGGAIGHQLSPVDDQHPVAGYLDFGQDVRRKDDRFLATDLLDELANLDDLIRIESGGGLIQNQDGWIVDHGLGERSEERRVGKEGGCGWSGEE